jgi:hypothetical protein
MARLFRYRASLLIGLCLLLAILPAAAGAAEPGRLMDAVLAEADGSTVTLSDLVLARALSLFGLSPSPAPIGAAELDRYLDSLLALQEAERLRIEVTPELRAAAWREAAARVGGAEALAAWLREAGVEEAWARRQVESDLAVRRFIAIRFRAFVFVSEAEVSQALGAEEHGAAARGGMRERLAQDATGRALAAWLAERRAQARIRRAALPPGGYLPPFPMPPESGRTAP